MKVYTVGFKKETDIQILKAYISQIVEQNFDLSTNSLANLL